MKTNIEDIPKSAIRCSTIYRVSEQLTQIKDWKNINLKDFGSPGSINIENQTVYYDALDWKYNSLIKASYYTDINHFKECFRLGKPELGNYLIIVVNDHYVVWKATTYHPEWSF